MPLSPFSEFFIKIARDDAALTRFLNNPDGDPEAARLTAEQKAALLSGNFQSIVAVFGKEDPLVEQEITGGTNAPNASPAAIGWNMVVLMDKINSQQSTKP